MVGPNGFELEAFSRRERAGFIEREPAAEILSVAKDLKRLGIEGYGRPEWIRTIDLFRVKEALWTN